MKTIVVVGGGISGLATAYYLQGAAADAGVTARCYLIDREPDLGGKIATRRQNGFVIEGGPDSFLAQKSSALELCRELGLTDHLIGASSLPGGTSILLRGRLVPLPEGINVIVPSRIMPFLRSPLVSWRGKLRMGLDLVIPPRRSTADESVAAFVRRRLGQEALEKIAQPLMAGIHAADPERLSLLATFPRFAELERQHGSLVRAVLRGQHARRSSPERPAGGAPEPARSSARDGVQSNGAATPPSAFLSFRVGMRELIDALVSQLSTVQLIRGRQVVRLACDQRPGLVRSEARAVASPLVPPSDGVEATGSYDVQLDDGSRIPADAVVLATPAYVSAALVETFNPALAAELRAIRYVSVATVSLGYRRSEVDHPLRGSGFVVPRSEKRAITACTWSSSKFAGRAPPDHVLLRAFLGGSGNEQILDLDDAALVHTVRTDLRQILGIRAEPVLAGVFRWPRGIPQYDVGHLDRVAALAERCDPGLFLAGSAYHGAGVPDCIATARRTAARALAYLSSIDPRSSTPLSEEVV